MEKPTPTRTKSQDRSGSKIILKIDNSKEKLPKSNLAQSNESGLCETNNIHPLFVLDEMLEKRQAAHGGNSTLLAKEGIKPISSKHDEPSNASSILQGENKQIEPPSNHSKLTDELSVGSSAVPSTVLSSENILQTNSSDYKDDNKIHLLLGVTGTISVPKIIPVVKKLFSIYSPNKIAIKIVMTESALNIANIQDHGNTDRKEPNLKKKTNWQRILDVGIEKIWTDKDAFNYYNNDNKTKKYYDKFFHSDPILHLELGKWADVMVIAPFSANTMAKVVNGLATNLLTTIISTWNRQKPIIAALSINSMAYSQPITKVHLQLMKEYFPHVQILQPMEKMIGKGGSTSLAGMREWPDIVEVIIKKIGPPSDYDEDNYDGISVSNGIQGKKDNKDGAEDDDGDDDDDSNEDHTDSEASNSSD